ncbi:MAG: SH3 domain-containing protein, partial [Anaerolineae bacterium]|nr:SH3 domain-containing protein [Anaerolineae bacterium]
MRKTAFRLITLLASLCLTLGTVYAQQLPQTSITILVNRDGVNVRVAPALGAEVLGFVQAGWTAPATGRSPDNQWVRIDFNGQEGWIGLAVINVFGDLNVLPVADPRSIPYGGFESPRSGSTSATSGISGRLALSGLRLRAGPGTAYPVLANPPRYTVFPLLGRTANNAWLQVNFNGTLGWLVTEWVEIQGGASIVSLPIDGVVADAAPQSEDTRENYMGTLKLMLARIDLAQPSLDSIRGTWTTVALGQRSACQNFPARPSDMNIANPLLAAFYPTLNPLLTDFNIAMTNLRQAIDLWLEACGQPQPASGVIGQATVQGALGIIQVTDGQFADLRRRLNELIPPEVTLGADECLFTFREQFDVLKIITKGQLVLDAFDRRKTATGYCIDVNAGDALRIEVLKVSGNVEPFVAF